MIIYIDDNYKCHAEPTEGLKAFEVPFFEGKCRRFIEGYRYVPQGETWVREDGERFQGEMIAPLVNYAWLAAYQAQYEENAEVINEYEAALSAIEKALGV